MKRRLHLCILASLVVGSGSVQSGATADGAEAGSSRSQDLEKARQFWAFQPVRSPAVPQTRPSTFRLRNPIDAFVLTQLQEKGLEPAPPATKGELIRRLTFDLTGLPPLPEEIQAFLEDDTSDAEERLVERLLGSPHFGERWAQHWLDVVRYAETEGFEYDRHLPDAWRYRDYVAQSFSRDKPFNQFVTEQIAGDEIDASDSEAATAAILYRLGPVRRNAGNPEIALSRNEVLTERTDVIGAAFLGLTVGCARCHDHKFDPISQKDYYRLQAFLAATHENDVLLVPPEERKAWEEKTKTVNGQLRKLREAANRAEGDERVKLNKEVEALQSKLPPYPATLPGIHNDPAQRTEIHVLKRGEWERKGELVGPRPLSVLVADNLPELPTNLINPRTELARWLVDPRNPLTARVIVNRLWQYHFGVGLVKTPNDFGLHGDRPSHPELLDWLAAELVRSGWRLKPLHRLILASSTYQQSARQVASAAATKTDPENRLFWRFEQRRLSAEEIRDTMLAVSGQLNCRVGGPSVMVPVEKELTQQLYQPAQWEARPDVSEHHRRSIYLLAKRNLRLPFMETFDQPALLTSCGRRESSTHAPQALELLNGRLSNELAVQFAHRLEKETGGDQDRIVTRAYQLAMGRPPTAAERSLALAFLGEGSLPEFALALFNLNSFLYVQ